jgi:hypothetical protein
LAPAGNEVTLASLNLGRFFDTTHDPYADPVLIPTAFARPLAEGSIRVLHRADERRQRRVHACGRGALCCRDPFEFGDRDHGHERPGGRQQRQPRDDAGGRAADAHEHPFAS